MQKADLLSAINEIFINVLEDNSLIINEQTSAEDIDAWDSLNHIQLIVAIEKRFKVKFSANEIYSWKNVSDMCQSIQEKSVMT